MCPHMMYKVLPDKIECENYMKLLKETAETAVKGTLEIVEMESAKAKIQSDLYRNIQLTQLIDKQYILGYSLSSNGRINTDENAAPYLRADALRNRVVDGVFSIILNPRNQINLTMPVTTDRMQSLAKRSKMGEAAKYMSPYNPASKYLMQIQNMVGKAVIGNVATALKSFFALSNVYNTKFREINEAIQTGNFDIARTMLKRYTFIHNDRLITLANVNMEVFESLPENTPEDIRQTLAQVISYEDALDDQSMVLGELLNAATDENSKQ